MNKKLENKVAVVTGGSARIGLGTANRFVAEGAQVFITGRRQSELDKAGAEVGGNVTAIQTQLSFSTKSSTACAGRDNTETLRPA
jgi:NADP-dependent 3-hydroxy acid dehydrogenase YdfG